MGNQVHTINMHFTTIASLVLLAAVGSVAYPVRATVFTPSDVDVVVPEEDLIEQKDSQEWPGLPSIPLPSIPGMNLLPAMPTTIPGLGKLEVPGFGSLSGNAKKAFDESLKQAASSIGIDANMLKCMPPIAMPSLPGKPTPEAISKAVEAWAKKQFSLDALKASVDKCVKEGVSNAETAVCKAIYTSIDSNIRASLAAASGGTSIVFNAGTQTATGLASLVGAGPGRTDAVKEIDRCVMTAIPLPGQKAGTCAIKAGLPGGCKVTKLRL